MREGFVYLDSAVSGAFSDAKYAGCDNFTGRAVDGYLASRVVGSNELAAGLNRAAEFARDIGLALLLWDGYRPRRAVDFFMKWTRDAEDGKTKARHYPGIAKTDLVNLGYIAQRSGHSRGGTIDLTLCDITSGAELDMGGWFDLMDEVSRHGAAGISEAATRNRALLRGIMERAGFRAYSNEWWHYTLAEEPYPDEYFDFPIE